MTTARAPIIKTLREWQGTNIQRHWEITGMLDGVRIYLKDGLISTNHLASDDATDFQLNEIAIECIRAVAPRVASNA